MLTIKEQFKNMFARALVKRRRFYALPYCNLFDLETEYLISNPNQSDVLGELYIWGKKLTQDSCMIVHAERIKLGPHCTQIFKIPSDIPTENRDQVTNYAGHAILIVSAPIIIHILYYSPDRIVIGEELVGTKDILPTKGKTYAFGYRTESVDSVEIETIGFISNLSQNILRAKVALYDQNCKLNSSKEFTIRPFCSVKFDVPDKLYGYGRIEGNYPTLINIMHLSDKKVASAELIKESHQVDGPACPESGRSKTLFDARRIWGGDSMNTLLDFKSALRDKGYQVDHHTSGEITAAVLNNHDVLIAAIYNPDYTDDEKNAISKYVEEGGSLMIIGEYGHGRFSDHTITFLNLFGAIYDDNMVEDPTNYFQEPFDDTFWVLYDAERNFIAHPVLTGIESIMLYAASSLSGLEWNRIIVTDDDSVPPNCPVLISRLFGEGRILAIGDSSFLHDSRIVSYDNRRFAIQCVEWLLFRI